MTVQAPTDLQSLEPAKLVQMLADLTSKLPQAKLDYEHAFPAPGFYSRTMKAPAGCLIIGDVHALNSVVKLVSGKLIVWDEDNGTQILEAPFEAASPAGVQRVGYMLTPVEWNEVFETPVTDLALLEFMLRGKPKAKELTQ